MQCPGFEGQIEEWIQGRSLSLEEMRSMSSQIAIALARLHSSPVDSLDLPTGGVLDWIQRWRQLFEKTMKANDRQRQELERLVDLDTIHKSLALLVDRHVPAPLVLCHNDLLQGNILQELNHRNYVRFLDFEYANLGEAAFDIANHFNEYCGFQEGPDMYPSPVDQEAFLSSYLAHLDPQGEAPPTSDALMQAVRSYTPFSHYLWGVWSFRQYCSSPLDFDYLGYCQRRLTECCRTAMLVLNSV
ncbi:MAG: hypothetical protein KVP17_003993 [Porospora cf. gigantea B]|uniref:uncharacterized protein n=1 Tax=Porospora cf. gigantea B TaxID=2853592 RepID=UPI003571CFB2|nr:MAG: hypothetical protein KVP17_003993 [Porospora cf. gigantea B]